MLKKMYGDFLDRPAWIKMLILVAFTSLALTAAVALTFLIAEFLA